nr:uncharacterized protein LOC110152205 isoform X3 [Odocoileus virginianus texanus]
MGPLCSLPTLVLAGNCTVLQAFQDEREGPAFSLQGSCTQAAASCMPIMACHGHPRPAILPCGCFPASHSLCACHSPTAPTRVSALLLSAGLTLARLQGLQSTLSNHNSPGPVPRAGCRDCGLQDTSWSKEVLDRLYTSNFDSLLLLPFVDMCRPGSRDTPSLPRPAGAGQKSTSVVIVSGPFLNQQCSAW